MEFLKWLVGSSGFMPHGYCYRWVPGLVWLHGVSDSLIFVSYMSIPVTLLYIVRRRKDLPFNWMFVCFGLFIVACGLTHAMEVWNLWHAMYWLAGLIKAVTAAASVATALLLVRLVPQAVGIPSAADLYEANARLIGQSAALRASEGKFRGLLEAAPDAMVIVDPGGIIELANAQTERLFGYKKEELLGQSVDMLVPKKFREGHGAHREGFFAEPKVREMGKGLTLYGLRKDGTEFPVEISLSPLETDAGTLALAAIRDGTERRKAETKYSALLEAAPDAMVVVNQAGKIVLLNLQAEKQFGYYRDELLGQQVTNIIPEGFAERLIADDSRSAADALAQQIGTGIELSARRKNGSEFPIEIMLSPLENAEEILVTAAIRDISARKRSEEHLAKTAEGLKRSNEQLEQFAYVASHDLQEPLRMVASYTQLLAKRYQGRLDSDADEFIAYAVDGCNRMQGLIRDLLAYSRSGNESAFLREISVETALKEALANLRVSIEESHAVVTHDLLPAITSENTQLVQVLQNLIGNAIKYRGTAAPHVHISAMKSGGKEWIVSVRDNGLGIAPQYFERIFIIFQRLHGRQDFNGTGIGLAICKKIVGQMGGRIWVESQVGKGSTFYFSLPENQGK